MAKVYIDGDWDDEDRIKRKSADFLTRARQGAVAAATDAVSGKATVEWKPRTGKHRSAAIASKAVIFDIASSASAGTGSSANAAPLDWLGWRARLTGSKAEKKAARRLVHNAARKIQSAARAKLASLRAEEEARFQIDLQQALRESVGAPASASTNSATAITSAPDDASRSAVSMSDSYTATAAATSFTLSTVALPPPAAFTTAANRTSTLAARTALTQIASSGFIAFRPGRSHEMLPEGTYLPPCTMGAAMGPWGHVLFRDMVPQQPTPCSHGEPTHVDAQNERVNSRGKPYVSPPPPGPRGCNGGSHRSLMKRAKEKAKRQEKRAATGQRESDDRLSACS